MPAHYNESLSLQKLARDIVERYEFYLQHIDLGEIIFFEKEGIKPKKAKVCQICGLSGPWVKEVMASQVKKCYSLEVWRSEWDDLHSYEQQWLVFTELYAIDKKRNGKLRKPNVNEFDIIVELLGPKWRKNPELLPDMLGDEPVPIPLPEDENENEDSTLEE